jgi:hypothetical protein
MTPNNELPPPMTAPPDIVLFTIAGKAFVLPSDNSAAAVSITPYGGWKNSGHGKHIAYFIQKARK